MSDFKYRPEVDGLRAVAVGMVLLFHAGLGFPGGYVGVDIFFVISGYLITGLILKEQQAGQFSLANFWLRRIRRIIPASSVVVAAVLAAGYCLLLPEDYAELGKSACAQQLMVANVFFWRNTGYFDGSADLKPLLHTWSLAVEEQFYLGYPFVLMALRGRSRRTCLAVLGLVSMVSLAASQFGVAHHPSATFYLLPTRIWELQIGGLVCFLPPPTRLPGRLGDLLSWLSMCAMVGTGLVYQPNTPFPGLAALAPCVATAVFIYANTDRLAAPARILASRPVVFIGLISYSLYLWHWPVLAYLRYQFGEELSPSLACSALAASVGLACLSWKFVETPLRQKRWLVQPRRLVASAGLSGAALCAAGLLISTSGVRSRFSESFLQMVAVPYAGKDWGATGSPAEGWHFPRLGAAADDALGPPAFLLWGDSYSKCVSSLCDEIARRHRVAGFDAGKGGTPPLVGAWTGTEGPAATSYSDAVIEFSEREQLRWLVLIAGWDIHTRGLSKLSDGQGGDALEVFQRSFQRTLQLAESRGLRVAVVLQVPYQHRSVPLRVARNMLRDTQSTTFGVDLAEHREFQRNAREFFESFGDRLVLIDLTDDCFEGERSVIGRSGTPYYSDVGHPSREGVRVFYERTLDELFQRIASESTMSASRRD